MSNQVSDRIDEVLEQLTPRERVVFEMRHYQGMRLKAMGRLWGYRRSGKELPVSSHAKNARGAGRFCMKCHEVQSNLSLYLYGELPFAAEEALEEHLAGCAFCQQAVAREKTWHGMLRAGDAGASLELLSQCRSELRKNVSVLPKEAPAIVPFWRKVKAWVDVPVLQWSSRAALAGFLVLIGFGLGRLAIKRSSLSERNRFELRTDTPCRYAGTRSTGRGSRPGQSDCRACT